MGRRCGDPGQSRQVVRNIVRHHHERYDGTGYPDGLKGEAIPIEARIVAIADIYDALITDRPYRKRLKHDETLGLLKKMRGVELDPALVDLFFICLRAPDFGVTPRVSP